MLNSKFWTKRERLSDKKRFYFVFHLIPCCPQHNGHLAARINQIMKIFGRLLSAVVLASVPAQLEAKVTPSLSARLLQEGKADIFIDVADPAVKSATFQLLEERRASGELRSMPRNERRAFVYDALKSNCDGSG